MAVSRSRQLRVLAYFQLLLRTIPCFFCCANPSARTSKEETAPMMLQTNKPKTRKTGCGTSDSNHLWFNWDACGLVCATIVWVVELGSLYQMHVHVLSPWLDGSVWLYVNSLLLITVVTLGLLSHARAMLSNPGAVPITAKPLEPIHWDRHCHKCNHFKPPRAHHCSVCRRCIVKMDHHCPWVNTCVGLGNHKYFILFVTYILSMCLYSLSLIFFRFLHCVSPTSECQTSASSGLWMIILTGTALLFGLFTGCLLVDQLQNIVSNTTQIDRLKGDAQQRSTQTDIDDRKQFWHNLGEVFGGDPARDGVSWEWFFPVAVRFNNPEQMAGYCFRDCPKPRTTAEMEMV